MHIFEGPGTWLLVNVGRCLLYQSFVLSCVPRVLVTFAVAVSCFLLFCLFFCFLWCILIRYPFYLHKLPLSSGGRAVKIESVGPKISSLIRGKEKIGGLELLQKTAENAQKVPDLIFFASHCAAYTSQERTWSGIHLVFS